MPKIPPIRTKKQLLLIALGALALLALCTLLLLPFIRQLLTETGRQAFIQWIDSFGTAGVLVMLGIQMLQIIVAFIPGEPVELLGGVLYGTWGGLAVCMLGCMVASIAVFLVVRRFGTPLVERVFGKDKLHSFSFLKDAQKVDTAVFLLFLIPGTPKDMLTYIVPLSTITLPRFIVLSSIARLPSVISSTMMGATARQGDWHITLLVLAVTALVGFVGIRTHDRAIAAIKRLGDKIKHHKTEG